MAATGLKIVSNACINCRDVCPHPSSSTLFSKRVGLRLCVPSKKLSPSQTLKPASSRFSTISIVSEQKPSFETVTAADVTDKTWKTLVLDSDIPVVVDFWAPWCGPCRMILPLIDELSKEYAGKVRFLKLNTDECPNTATEYGIRSIPTIMVFIGGQRRDTVIGAVSKTSLVSTIEKFFE